MRKYAGGIHLLLLIRINILNNKTYRTVNKPFTHQQVKDLPLGFTATDTGENRRERRLDKQPNNMNNRPTTIGRRWFRNVYLPKLLKARMLNLNTK